MEEKLGKGGVLSGTRSFEDKIAKSECGEAAEFDFALWSCGKVGVGAVKFIGEIAQNPT